MKIVSAKKILAGNDKIARENLEFFEKEGVFVLNLLGSPGAGKTSLLEALLPRLGESMPVAVIEGDLATSQDAERVAALGVPVVQVNTEGACHLDAAMVSSAAEALDLPRGGILFIENVGNLVCPAGFRLGEHLRLVVLSITEGDDKVAKYPPMFRKTQAVALNKIDLAGALEFDEEKVRKDLERLLPGGRLFRVSARTGLGLEEVETWLREERACRFEETSG